jgi:hypothetical protein
MGMLEGRAKVGKSVKELMAHWTETKSQWDDFTSKKFEEKFLTPIQQDAKQAAGAMDAMSQILQQAKRDCE